MPSAGVGSTPTGGIVAITDTQLKQITTGDRLVRSSGGTATVRNTMRSTNGDVALEIDSYWEEGETRIVTGAKAKNEFPDVRLH